MNFLPTHTRSSRLVGFVLLLVLLVSLTGCDKMGDMINQPRYDPYEASSLFPNGQSARTFPEGVVPYTQENGVSPNDPSVTGLDADGNPVKAMPVKVTKEMVQYGMDRYNIYCVVCHGPTGEGNGRVIGFGFSKPPNLLTDGKKLSNGEIFAIITHGRGKMFPYGYRVKADERWAVIAYVRAMQQAGGAVKPQDLTEDQLNSLGNQP